MSGSRNNDGGAFGDIFRAARRIERRTEGLARITRRLAALDHADPAAQLELRRELSPLYLRFGHPPPGGRSANPLDGRTLEGCSVFRASLAPSGIYVVEVAPSLALELSLGWLMHEARPVYRVFGRTVGRGPDEEPLLADVVVEPLEHGAVVMSSMSADPGWHERLASAHARIVRVLSTHGREDSHAARFCAAPFRAAPAVRVGQGGAVTPLSQEELRDHLARAGAKAAPLGEGTPG